MKRILDYFQNTLNKNIKEKFVLFGQNITTGSRISGMTAKIGKIKKSKIINCQNSEQTLVGFGLGMMMGGIRSIYFAKQLDFLLLAMDQIVNTFNYILYKKKIKSFSIFTYIVDSGFEGPQSRMHNLQEISSLSFVNCTYLVFPKDIEKNLKKINKNTFNIFCLSQKNSKLTEFPKKLYESNDNNIFKYLEGKNGAAISYGFSAYDAYKKIIKEKLNFDFFVITDPSYKLNQSLLNKLVKKKNIYIFDDTRSNIKNADLLEKELLKINSKLKIRKFYKYDKVSKLKPNNDKYLI